MRKRLVDEIGRTLHEADSGEYPEFLTASAFGGGDARAYCMAVRILFEALQAHLVGLLQEASQCALLARGLCACVESQDIRHAARFLTPGT